MRRTSRTQHVFDRGRDAKASSRGVARQPEISSALGFRTAGHDGSRCT
ncbi:hypothetical protein ACCUM_1834 [Candidatus Accumulibacter phosphatis]|uniref:Uncharacterized protein n=1 Tax=Candidatus Accumulibacter phosphatis TaxID=327160 RepID=A0A5S4ESD3_9PROT|nr:hypothetical protein ACCUM_1834 [Candidatus Accumulibacter phosphatis]